MLKIKIKNESERPQIIVKITNYLDQSIKKTFKAIIVNNMILNVKCRNCFQAK
jgi:hypothetical protein